jgi:hypothetical protein
MIATAKRGPVCEEMFSSEWFRAELEALEPVETFLGFFIRLNIP